MEVEEEERAAILDEIWKALSTKVPRYAEHQTPSVQREVRAASVDAVRCFERLINGVPVRRAIQAIDFDDTVSQRLAQGFSLQDLLSAARVECAVLWRHVARLLEPERLPGLGELMLEWLDITCGELEHRYELELEGLRDSRQDSVELFFRRVTSAEPLSTMADNEARLLGHDIDQLQTGVVVGSGSTGTHPTADRASLMDLARVVRRTLPATLVAVVEDRLTMAYPSTLGHRLSELLRRELSARPGYTAGVGGAYPGTAGLRQSLDEAARARSIASLMRPGGDLAVYADLRAFDIFSHGEAIDAFVEEVLGPLVLLDRSKGSRLVHTLATFYDTGMNRKATASRLNIHANTLDYRMRQVEGILPGYSQGGGGDFRVPLALKLLPTMQRPLTDPTGTETS